VGQILKKRKKNSLMWKILYTNIFFSKVENHECYFYYHYDYYDYNYYYSNVENHDQYNNNNSNNNNY
jgi:hypothetical protein